MDITLTYAGCLPPRGKSRSGLQAIWNVRNALSRQLEHFYTTNPILNPEIAGGGSNPTRAAAIAARTLIKVEGFDFVALARPRLGLGCRIDMDMLVNHQPGSIITHAGDLDNRIKTLFDALRVPRGKNEIQHHQPMLNCCYCLMEDDALIDTLAVRMKRLNEAQPDPQFVRLHINVTVRGITPGFISDVF